MGIKKFTGALLMALTAGAMGVGAFELQVNRDQVIRSKPNEPSASYRGDFNSDPVHTPLWTTANSRWLTGRPTGKLDLVNHRYHMYQLTINPGEGGSFRITSKRHEQGLGDPYLLLCDSNGHWVAEDDDNGADPRNPNTRLDARIETILRPGTYMIIATSYRHGDSGYYDLEVTRR